MANAESIVKYKQKYSDSLMAGIATAILNAYAKESGLPKADFGNKGGVVYHTPDGYALIAYEKPEGYKLHAAGRRIADFIEQVYSTFAQTEVRATEVAQSEEVLKALEKKFNMKVELNLTKNAMGNPAVWTTYKGADKNLVKAKGFEYYDKGRWVIWL